MLSPCVILVEVGVDRCVVLRCFYSRCVSNQRALLESGTMGPKGHVQVRMAMMFRISFLPRNLSVNIKVPRKAARI